MGLTRLDDDGDDDDDDENFITGWKQAETM